MRFVKCRFKEQFILIIFFVVCRVDADAAMLSIAASSDLKFVMDDLVKEFERKQKENHFVQVTYGSSGSFVAQLIQQAPFDLFFSANLEYVDFLIEKKIALADSKMYYAMGSLVLWMRNGLDVNFEKFGMNVLLHSSIRKISIANPHHAPYGKAAEAALMAAGLNIDVKNKLVYAENVAQAAQFVQAGAAQIGLIALSIAKAPAMRKQGRYWLVPQRLYQPIRQAAVRMLHAQNVKKSNEFMIFIKSALGKKILEQYGFSTQESQSWIGKL